MIKQADLEKAQHLLGRVGRLEFVRGRLREAIVPPHIVQEAFMLLDAEGQARIAKAIRLELVALADAGREALRELGVEPAERPVQRVTSRKATQVAPTPEKRTEHPLRKKLRG